VYEANLHHRGIGEEQSRRIEALDAEIARLNRKLRAAQEAA
jgi:hypothetical protein